MERNIRLNWSELVNEAVKRRKQQKLTQKQLATLIGVSGPTVNSFEQERTNVTLESCLKILRFLGLVSENLALFESEDLENLLRKNKKINSYFINLKESGNFVEPIEDAFKLSQTYLDKDFKKLFSLEVDFFPRLWELFVCNTLLQSKAADLLQETKGKGPDFLLKEFFEGKSLYIECVCPQDANPQKSGNLIKNESFTYTQEKTLYGDLEGYSAQPEGFDESIVSRYSSSIHDKSEKFKNFYQYTEGHYRVLCVSGCVLNLLKSEKYASFDQRVSTKEDFETVIRGVREYYFDKNGDDGFRDSQLKLSKGDNTIINLGHHEDLAAFDAIVFSDYFPFLTNTSGNIYNIYPKEDSPTEFKRKLEEIFTTHQ